jgi:hypothetical protein
MGEHRKRLTAAIAMLSVCVVASLIAAKQSSQPTSPSTSKPPAQPARPPTPPSSAPSAEPAIQMQTLRELLKADEIDPSGIRPADVNLDAPIASSAADNTSHFYTMAYYVDSGTGALPSTLRVSMLEKARHIWHHASLPRRRERDLGSLMTVRHTGALIYIDTHLNPSAGTILVLSPRLELVTTLSGWMLDVLDDGSVLYHRSAIHFAPTHTAELGFYDARARTARQVYPRKPYQPLRKAYIERVRKVYAELTEREPDWRQQQNHHGDPEQFDSGIGRVLVAPGTRRIAFMVRFGSDDVRPPTPEEHVLVTCNLAMLPADPCRESPKADWLRRYPNAKDEELLKAALRE